MVPAIEDVMELQSLQCGVQDNLQVYQIFM